MINSVVFWKIETKIFQNEIIIIWLSWLHSQCAVLQKIMWLAEAALYPILSFMSISILQYWLLAECVCFLKLFSIFIQIITITTIN